MNDQLNLPRRTMWSRILPLTCIVLVLPGAVTGGAAEPKEAGPPAAQPATAAR